LGYDDGSIFTLHQQPEKDQINLIKHKADVRTLCKVTWKTMDYIFSGDINGVIHVWNPNNYQVCSSLVLYSKEDNTAVPVFDMTCVPINSEITQVWVASYKYIYVIQLSQGDNNEVPKLTISDYWLAHTSRIRSIITVDKTIWTCSADGICIWFLYNNDSSTEKSLVRSYSFDDVIESIEDSNEVSDEEKSVLRGYSIRNARRPSILNVKKSRVPAHFLGAHYSEVNKLIKVSPTNCDETHVWSCSFDKTIMIWGTNGRARPRCRQELYGHKGSVDYIVGCDPGIVCSSSMFSKDKSLHFWQYNQNFKLEPKGHTRIHTDPSLSESVL